MTGPPIENSSVCSSRAAMKAATAASPSGPGRFSTTTGWPQRAALAYLRPVTDVYRVDLKGWDAAQYKTLGGRVDPVLAAIGDARALGYWVEVVTLVVPSFNDEESGLRGLAKKLVAIDPDVPWHLNAFQPRYKMKDRPAMSAGLLVSVAGSAYARGLRYVYVGNVSDVDGQSTRCPSCDAVVVERAGYDIGAYRVKSNRCAACRAPLAGVFEDRPGNWGARRMPLRIVA